MADVTRILFAAAVGDPKAFGVAPARPRRAAHARLWVRAWPVLVWATPYLSCR